MNKNIINKILDQIDDEESFQKLYKIDPELINKYFVKRFMNNDVVEFYHLSKNKSDILEYNNQLLETHYHEIWGDSWCKCSKCYRLYPNGGYDNNDSIRYCYTCDAYYCSNCYTITKEIIESIIADEDQFCSKDCLLKFIKNENEECIKCNKCCKYYANQSRECKICQKEYCMNCLPNYKEPCDNCLNSSDHIYSNYGIQTC